MPIDPNFPNPYLPTDAKEQAELDAFKQRSRGRHSQPSTRIAFLAGIQARRQHLVVLERIPNDEQFTNLWDDFVTADMKLPRTYPDSADAFVAGYRLGLSY
jgi:hypothetical protein